MDRVLYGPKEEKGKDKWKRVQEAKAAAKVAAGVSGIVGISSEGGAMNEGLSNTTTEPAPIDTIPVPTPGEPTTAQVCALNPLYVWYTCIKPPLCMVYVYLTPSMYGIRALNLWYKYVLNPLYFINMY
jgi:hypothetical protein